MNKPHSRTVPTLLVEITSRGPEKLILTDGPRSWSYSAFTREVERAARALLASGIAHGDRIGLLAGNRAEWLIVDFAAMSIGAIAVGLNTWASARELAYQLAHAQVKLLILEPKFRERDFIALLNEARQLAEELPRLTTVVELTDSEQPEPEHLSYAKFLQGGSVATSTELVAASSRVKSDDIACLLYTSGSTALPKGVPLLHRGLIDNMWEIGERQHLVAGDRLWLAVSLFWSLACVNAVFALVTHGGSIVLQHHFDAGEALRLIETERCTVFYGTPNMALALAEHPDRTTRDLSSLRTGVTIGTPAQVQRVAELGATRICNVYGLTETYGNSTVADADLPLARRTETVGQVLRGNELRILNPETGAEQAVGSNGEIVIRGNVTPGYWQDSARTAEAFAEGWFHTGDLGFMDAEGYLHYRGRLKEMVKTGGINVAPAEVEEILSAHPAVELAFVTGIPDPRLDEALAAVIVARTGQAIDEAVLRTHCKAVLAAYKIPRQFKFIEASALPLTTTGKLQRNRLPELFS